MKKYFKMIEWHTQLANKKIMTNIYLGWLVAHRYSTRNLLVTGV